jgi:hypothetical protein
MKNYIRTNKDGFIILAWPERIKPPTKKTGEKDVVVQEDGNGHFNINLIDEKGRFCKKWNGSKIIDATQASIEAANPETQEQANQKHLTFLKDTDYKVSRHLEQTATGATLSLTQAQYDDLLLARQTARDSIII